jgi:hypothetical protein
MSREKGGAQSKKAHELLLPMLRMGTTEHFARDQLERGKP